MEEVQKVTPKVKAKVKADPEIEKKLKAKEDPEIAKKIKAAIDTVYYKRHKMYTVVQTIEATRTVYHLDTFDRRTFCQVAHKDDEVEIVNVEPITSDTSKVTYRITRTSRYNCQSLDEAKQKVDKGDKTIKLMIVEDLVLSLW